MLARCVAPGRRACAQSLLKAFGSVPKAFLPPKDPKFAEKKTLVLDMDETLLTSTLGEEREPVRTPSHSPAPACLPACLPASWLWHLFLWHL
jgi:hypothetical protein